MNIHPTATEAIKAPDIQPFIPNEIEGDNLELRSDQIVPSIDESVLSVINEQLKPHSIKFKMDDGTAILQVIDSTNDRVIREIPNQEMKVIIDRIMRAVQTGTNVGVLIDELV